MINFRYHVVSLTAVFLALAIGLVVGTAALNGPVADSLNDRVTGLSKSNDQLRESVNNLEAEAKREEDYAAEFGPHLLAGKLATHQIMMLTLPSGRDQADGVMDELRQTGATITGRIDVQDKFVEPENNDQLLGLAERAAQPTIPTSGLPGNSDGVETSGALLASALLDRTQGGPVSENDRKALLALYTNDGYITIPDKISGPAEAVVVVAGQPYVDRDASKKDDSVVKMVVQFDKAAALVVAGNGSAGGNVVAAVRADPALSQTISTVDDGNTTVGQVVSAMAMVEQITLKKAGHYGLGAGAASLMPKQPE